jgi:hypothetical protein
LKPKISSNLFGFLSFYVSLLFKGLLLDVLAAVGKFDFSSGFLG